jgi:hypothetical protein
LCGKANSLKNFIPGCVLQELIRKPNFAQGCINLCCAKVLPHSGSDATNANTVFNCHNQAMFSSHLYNRARNRNHPSWVNNGCPDTLIGKHLGNLNSSFRHCANGQD